MNSKVFKFFSQWDKFPNYPLLAIRKILDVSDSSGYHKWEQEVLHGIKATKEDMVIFDKIEMI